MENRGQQRGADCAQQIRKAKQRIEQVEARLQKARTRAEWAERRSELAEARRELAETRTALAEARAEQAECALQRVIRDQIDVCNGMPSQSTPVEGLTARQRDILRHIAEGQNTKQIADILQISPKTVEYHRTRLMRVLGVHDIPGLVRLAIRAGLVPAES